MPLTSVKSARSNSRWTSERGFTLVEMLVVITIIGLIMSLVGPRVLSYLGESKVKAAKIQIQSFASALDLFYLDTGRYPTTAEGTRRACQAACWRDGMEWSVPERRQCAKRSVGYAISLSIAGRAQPV
jgi:general secretion pathway protein G